MTKGKLGFWLLISLIPATLWGIISLVGAFSITISNPDVELEDNGAYAFWMVSFLLCFLYFFPALISGVVLRIWSNRERHQLDKETHQYAELHGWQKISRTSWRSLKASDSLLATNQAFDKSSHILSITNEGNTLTIPDFDSPALAMQFGDWFWDQLSKHEIGFNESAVQHQRTQWERTQSFAITPPRPTMDPRNRKA